MSGAIPKERFVGGLLGLAVGDDTDTLAAMAGALSGAHLGAGAIPARWVARLEGGPRGRDHVLRLAEALHERHAAGA